MNAEETLVYQSRNRTRQTIIAATGGVLFMVAAILGVVGPHAAVSEATLSLIVQHQRASLAIVAAVVNAVALVAIAVTLLYLWRLASARGDSSMPLVPIVVLIGTVIAVVAGIAYALEISAKASDFVSTGAQTYDEAVHLTGGSFLLVLQILSQLGSLLIAIAFVLVSLVTLRTGLLPRFLAYVGMIAGVLVLFPIIVVPVVALYWLGAVALLISGNWPSGLPPAWRSGQAEPWPSSAEMRARRTADAQVAREQRAERKRGGRRGRGGDVASPQLAATTDAGDGAPSADAAPAADAESAADSAGTRSATPKRKRKRRH